MSQKLIKIAIESTTISQEINGISGMITYLQFVA